MLIHQNRHAFELFSRRDGWARHTAGTGEFIELLSLGIRLSVDEVY